MSTDRFTTQDPASPRVYGRYSDSKVAFFGGTPTSRQAGAALSAGLSLFSVTGASLVAASAATYSGVFAFTSSQMAMVWDAIAELRGLVATLNMHKGGA